MSLAYYRDIERDDYKCASGRAYFLPNVYDIIYIVILFSLNIYHGVEEQKEFVSGKYVIRDIYCKNCSNTLGW